MQAAAAHVCYVIGGMRPEPFSQEARLCLVGWDHRFSPRSFSSLTSLQRTQILEWASPAQPSGADSHCLMKYYPCGSLIEVLVYGVCIVLVPQGKASCTGLECREGLSLGLTHRLSCSVLCLFVMRVLKVLGCRAVLYCSLCPDRLFL